MNFTGIASVAAITVICWLIGEAVSNTPLNNKWIPSIVGGCGMILGVVGWLAMPNFPADNILTAFAVGIVSGLASTGADQVVHQLNPSDKGKVTVPAYDDYDEEGNPIVTKDGGEDA